MNNSDNFRVLLTVSLPTHGGMKHCRQGQTCTHGTACAAQRRPASMTGRAAGTRHCIAAGLSEAISACGGGLHLGFRSTRMQESPRRNILLMKRSLFTGLLPFFPLPDLGICDSKMGDVQLLFRITAASQQMKGRRIVTATVRST